MDKRISAVLFPSPRTAAPPPHRAIPIRERGPRCIRWRTLVRQALPRVGRLAFLAAFAALAPRRAHAAFDSPLVTPQSSAMGGASLANTADSAALFLNPAASARLESVEAYFMYNQLYTGLSGVGGIAQGFAAVGAPTKYGAFAAGYGEFQAAGLLQERVIGLSYSRTLSGVLDAGVTGKYLAHNYLIGSDPAAANDPVFARGGARSAFALDAGVIASLTDSLKAGLAARNLNAPDVGLASEDRVPRELQAGLSYDFKAWALRLTADYVYRDVPSGAFSDRTLPSVGLEKGFVDDMVRFRAGATPDQFSGGIGIRLGPVDFDYTFILSRGLISNNAGTQQAGFRYRFGGSARKATARAVAAAAPDAPLPDAVAPFPSAASSPPISPGGD